MMVRLLQGVMTLLFVAACTALPPPSVQLRYLEPADQGHYRVSFSTDQLTRAEAQELLLLSAALVSRKEGGALFQFRSVSATGLVDELTEKVRYYDVVAVIDPLVQGERGDGVRKTYEAEGVIGFLGPKYLPLLPADLAEAYGAGAGG